MIYVLLKTLLSFALLWGITRLLGQKQISQLTLFDYITGITIGSLAAELISPSDHWKLILLSMVAWGALTWIFHLLDLKGRSIHRFLDGSPVIVIREGRIVESALRRLQLNVEELMSLLRVKGYFSLDLVAFALLETNGELSVLPWSHARPARPEDFALKPPKDVLQALVMQEGRVVAHGLQESGHTEQWLADELQRQGIKPDEVFAAWAGADDKLVVGRYDQT